VPSTVFDADIVDLFTEGVIETIGEEYIINLKGPHMGSEDFALYNEIIPKAALFRLGNTNPGEEYVSTHSDIYDFNDDALPYGIAAVTKFVLNKNNLK
jgi:metal-dependent amidase/aminoacylase/carboxypeptidase family protein